MFSLIQTNKCLIVPSADKHEKLNWLLGSGHLTIAIYLRIPLESNSNFLDLILSKRFSAPPLQNKTKTIHRQLMDRPIEQPSEPHLNSSVILSGLLFVILILSNKFKSILTEIMDEFSKRIHFCFATHTLSVSCGVDISRTSLVTAIQQMNITTKENADKLRFVESKI